MRSATVTNEKIHAVASARSLHGRVVASLLNRTTTQMIYSVGYKSDLCCVNLAAIAEESQDVAFTQY